MAEDGGHYVNLLGYAMTTALRNLTRGVKEKDWRAEHAEVCLILSVVGDIGVVAGEDKNGVFEPRLTRGGLEKTSQRMVCIADALVDDVGVHIRERVLIGLGDDKRVMT